ncbi:MAG: hypothetical protein K940chlam8_00691 [Chlamydiae bacterium]|nr:hypothetical protein [Chlamydiota bacterium]
MVLSLGKQQRFFNRVLSVRNDIEESLKRTAQQERNVSLESWEIILKAEEIVGKACEEFKKKVEEIKPNSPEYRTLKDIVIKSAARYFKSPTQTTREIREILAGKKSEIS